VQLDDAVQMKARLKLQATVTTLANIREPNVLLCSMSQGEFKITNLQHHDR
jgi:hypothetical protein